MGSWAVWSFRLEPHSAERRIAIGALERTQFPEVTGTYRVSLT